MLKGFSAELQRSLIILAICSLIGFISDNYALWMLIGCAIYILMMLWQMRRLNQWLLRQESEHPPEASGIWGQIFDNIYQLQRNQRSERSRRSANTWSSSSIRLRMIVSGLARRGRLSRIGALHCRERPL